MSGELLGVVGLPLPLVEAAHDTMLIVHLNPNGGIAYGPLMCHLVSTTECHSFCRHATDSLRAGGQTTYPSPAWNCPTVAARSFAALLKPILLIPHRLFHGVGYQPIYLLRNSFVQAEPQADGSKASSHLRLWSYTKSHVHTQSGNRRVSMEGFVILGCAGPERSIHTWYRRKDWIS